MGTFFALVFSAGLAASSAESPDDRQPRGTVEHAEAGESVAGKRKDGPKKKGPPRGSTRGGTRGGAEKGKGGRAGGKKGKRGGKGKNARPAPPWGRSSVVVGAAGGVSFAQARETAESDGDDVAANGTCQQEDCEPTNGAPGRGPFTEVTAIWLGRGDQPRDGGLMLRWNQASLQLQGDHRARPDGAEDESGVVGAVTDRAAYSLRLQHLEAGFAGAWKLAPKSPWFVMLDGSGGYAWGPVETTVESAPEEVVTGTVRGFTWGVQCSFGMALSKHLHVLLTPIDVDLYYLRPSTAASFPFLPDGKPVTSAATLKLGVMTAF